MIAGDGQTQKCPLPFPVGYATAQFKANLSGKIGSSRDGCSATLDRVVGGAVIDEEPCGFDSPVGNRFAIVVYRAG